MKWLIRRFRLPPRRIILWHSVAAIPMGTLVAFGAYLSYYYHELSSESRARVSRSWQLLDGIENVFASVEAAALAERDFVITGDDEAIVQFQQAATSFKEQVVQLTPLVSEETAQARELAAIDQAISAQFDDFSRAIEVRKNQGSEGARAIVSLQGTTATMSSLRHQIGVLTASERALLDRRMETEKRHERHLLWSGIAVALASILLRFGITFWMRRMDKLRNDVPGPRLPASAR
jgi:CHASE3 domain sensor protein